MVYKISDNIISPLGETTEANYSAIKGGKSALSAYTDKWNIPEPFYGSLFTEEQNARLAIPGFTRFESLVINSVKSALSYVSIPLSSKKVAFVLSTTKANVAELEESAEMYTDFYPGISAQRIAKYIGIHTEPIVVCNACISGVSAIITAKRLIENGTYDYAVVCGADCQSKFIISGFQSLKALSAKQCRPFDIERLGLNLGEAAATMILCSPSLIKDHETPWCITSGSTHNDAFHISSPSPKGEGSYRSLTTVLETNDATDLAFINLHGTATMYNDQMESKAVQRAELLDVPVNGFKGYYGHTMGAAGILETLLSMYSVDDHTIIGTRGYEERGVSGKLNLTAAHKETDKQSFAKLISGFGGCNAALYATHREMCVVPKESVQTKVLHTVEITPKTVFVDGVQLETEGEGKALLTHIYKRRIGEYPKFYKMDLLSRLGFIASELLIAAEGDERFTSHPDRGVILFNKTSSVVADKEYQKSISDLSDYYPSPAAFVYTLPNIVTGEIALRNQYHGETSFYILPENNQTVIDEVIHSALNDAHMQSVIGGWIDCESDNDFNATLKLIVKL